MLVELELIDNRYAQGWSQNLKLRGAVLLLVSCGGSTFRFNCLTANDFFFFFFFFLYVHPSMDKIILFKIF